MSGSDMSVYNKIYNTIDRPYANVDLTKIPSWDIVMTIMEQQALEARRKMAKYQTEMQNQCMPQSIANYEYQEPSFNYKPLNGTHGNNSAGSSEESDSSSCCSDMETQDTSSPSESESDVEIDVDNIDDEYECFMPSLDNIPITVLQLETKLREKDMK